MSSDRPVRALVVEDDRTTADLIALYLRREGCRVAVEHAGDRVLIQVLRGGIPVELEVVVGRRRQ